MNFQNSEDLIKNRACGYLLRVLVLYLFSVLFKSFDLSFIQEVKAEEFRSGAFSLFFVLFGFIAWEGAVRLAGAVEKKVSYKTVPGRLLVLGSSLLVYGALVSLLFGFFYGISDILLFNRYEAWEAFRSLSYDMHFGIFIFFMLILAFNGIIFYYKRWHEYQVHTERLMRENIQARYDALMNQIDPHFFFNSLSVLTNLVYKSADLSAEYITQLAKCYRYILDKKLENLISIEAELEFLDSYIFLIRIRHQNSIVFDINIDPAVKMAKMIPPATLQLLVENAVKHNRFSANDPLHISIYNEGAFLYVSNTLKKRILLNGSTGIGLDNIRKRYELTGGLQPEIKEENDKFTVIIPILEANESSHI